MDAGKLGPGRPDPAGDLDRGPGVVGAAVLGTGAEHDGEGRCFQRGLVGLESGEARPLGSEEVFLVGEEPLSQVVGPAIRPFPSHRLREPAAGGRTAALGVERGQLREEAARRIVIGQDVHRRVPDRPVLRELPRRS